MRHMLCHNRVLDYAAWRRVFDADAEAHRKAGLVLANIWRERDRPDVVHFLFEVHDLAKAKAFISAPDAGEHAKRSGVLEGSYRFLDSVALY